MLILDNAAMTSVTINDNCFNALTAFNHGGNTKVTKMYIGNNCFNAFDDTFKPAGSI